MYSLLLAVAILGLGGVGFWLIDPRIDSLGDGLWLAFTTAATVGYGDLIPHTPASRIFSVVVVLLGLAVLSLVTASLSAIFVEKEVQDEEREIDWAVRYWEAARRATLVAKAAAAGVVEWNVLIGGGGDETVFFEL